MVLGRIHKALKKFKMILVMSVTNVISEVMWELQGILSTVCFLLWLDVSLASVPQRKEELCHSGWRNECLLLETEPSGVKYLHFLGTCFLIEKLMLEGR